MDDFQKRIILNLCAAHLAWQSGCSQYFYAIQKGRHIYHSVYDAVVNPDEIGRRLCMVPDDVAKVAAREVISNGDGIYTSLIWG